MKHQTKKIYPKIKSVEHIVSFEGHNGKMKKVLDIVKKSKGKRVIIKGDINGRPVHITRKVRFPHDLISPNKGAITSHKRTFKPSGILKKYKTVKKH
jgi:hypothetical protein